MARQKLLYSRAHRLLVERLKAARAESGLTQRAVAKKLGRAPNYIAKVEAGDKTIGLAELESLATAYRKRLDYFDGCVVVSPVMIVGRKLRVLHNIE